jgi:hypothetical protein
MDMEHEFTPRILKILARHFGNAARDIFLASPLLQYINLKTVSAGRGSKARSSFANLYAVYVLVEDYIKGRFYETKDYSEYEGARFSDLFRRQRQLPFGSKLQNHALNHRMNEEFRKFFPHIDVIPILRVVETKRYWINESLLRLAVAGREYNVAHAIVEIVEEYIKVKQSAFEGFIKTCERLKTVGREDREKMTEFVVSLLAPNVDARVFEIVSYAVLKYYYYGQAVYFGFDPDSIEELPLTLYKTGRTNANDGGIDFVMRPLGRFFQVTETLDVRKYFLDIDKIERYPISFVIKSTASLEDLTQRLRDGAKRQYTIKAIVGKYMSCIEEIINIPVLKERLADAIEHGHLEHVLEEIIRQSKVEFNIVEKT